MEEEMGLIIAIDGIFMASSQPGGYRTYTTSLVSALTRCGEAHSFRLLMDGDVNFTLPLNWCVDSLPRAGSLGFIWREQVSLPRFLKAQDVDIFHAPGATGPMRISIPVIVTIYDTIEFTDPLPSMRQTKRWAMRLYSRVVQAQIAKTARHVITISGYSKRRITERLGIPSERVTVIHLAPAPAYSPVAGGYAISRADKLSGLSGLTGYVLGIASAAPRKNTSLLLAAYSRLPKTLRQDHPLVLVCTHASVIKTVRAKVSTLSLEEQVKLFRDIGDNELAEFYRGAKVFVFPSLEEGFGLPPLEAMACGTPVIASNTSSLPEVLGNAAVLVDPRDINALTGAIEAVLTDPILTGSLRERGLAHSRQFSWEKTARETVDVYELVGAGRYNQHVQ